MTTLISPSIYCSFSPLWKGDVTLIRGYFNKIQHSLDGSEQRNLLNTKVRRVISYSLVTKNEKETSYLLGITKTYLTSIWGCPFWMYPIQLTSAVSSGSTTLNVDATNDIELEADDEIMIHKKYDRYEVATVDSLTDTQITVTSGLSNGWDVGTKLYPILRSKVENTLVLVPETLGNLAMKFEFRESFRAQ